MKTVLERPVTKRFLVYGALGLFLALITGPDGSQAKPWSGFKQSWFSGHGIGWLIFALAIAAVVQVLQPRKESISSTFSSTRATITEQAQKPVAKLLLLAVFAFIVLAVPPLFLSNFWLTVLVDQIGIYVLLAMGLNVVVGFAGLLDLGFIAFYAFGAYTTAYFTGKLHDQDLHFLVPPIVLNPFFIFPIAALVAMTAGFLLGAPTLRLRGDYLAIVTLGFGEIVRITAINTDKFGGPNGAFGLPDLSVNLGFFHYDWDSQLSYYYLIVAVVGIVYLLLQRLEDSRIGRAWTAIREDEVAAEASGIPTLKLKLMAFAIGASTSGFAGVIFASRVGSFTPDNFALINSLLVLVMVIFGGMGSIKGVMVGAAILGWLPNFLRDPHFGLPAIKPTDRYIYFGALLIIMMIFRPQGLIPSKRRAREIAMEENPETAIEAVVATSKTDLVLDDEGGAK